MAHRIVIVGAGAAGVLTAYRLREMYGDLYDIVLLEKTGRVGGNAYTTQVEYGGRAYSIDCGAQFFYKNPQVSYVELLEQIGLFDEDDQREIVSAAAGMTIWDRAANERLFYVPPRLSGFLDYDADDWERLLQFGYYLVYSYFLDRGDTPWTKSVDEWLAGLELLDAEFKERVIKRFMYQFVTLPQDRIGEASARYAVTYFVRNVFGEPRVDEPDPQTPSVPGLPVFETYQSLIGLDGILLRLLAIANVTPRLDCGVDGVVTTASGVVVHAGSEIIPADHVVLACDPQVSANILAAGRTTPPELAALLRQMEYATLPISMQKDGPCWMPDDEDYRQAINTIVDDDQIAFSAWFGPLRAPYGQGQRIPVYKSWGSPGLVPGSCAHEFLAHEHRVLQPTTAFVAARDELAAWQGQSNVWFAGGWTNWFDSQEAALDSATFVANALPGEARPRTGPARMVAVDHARTERNLRRWLERMSRQAPDDKKQPLADALDEIGTRG